MKLKEIIAETSLKAAAKEVGMEYRMVDGRMECTPVDPEDPRHCGDFFLPTAKMVEVCRADDFDFFRPFIEAGRLTMEQMHRAAARYHLGKTRSGKSLFWMIDETQDPQDAHIGDEGWISTALKAREPLLQLWCPTHCLFGLHLLSTLNPVSIVESEASAVVLSELFPEVLWMAYATVDHLDVELFASLQGRKVTFYPATDPSGSTYLFFLDLAEAIRQRYNIHITVATILEDHASPDQKDRCIDLLEFLLSSDKNRKNSDVNV